MIAADDVESGMVVRIQNQAKFQRLSWLRPAQVLLLSTAGLAGCTNQPTEAQLNAWQQETIQRNATIVEARASQAQERQWTLTIQGQTRTGQSLLLEWEKIQSLTSTHVPTKDPHHTTDLNAILDFRGVLVSQLLKTVGQAPNVSDVTFVALDGFRGTVPLKDLQQYPIILAIERDKQPIPRAEGGPIYLVFPFTQYPELDSPKRPLDWVFYVTHMIVGTEPVRVRVGQQEFERDDFDRLPQTTLTEPVGYKLGWPNGKVQLQGVRIRDLLTAAQVSLSDRQQIVVRGKAAIHRDSTKPIALTAQDVQNCDILLVTRWGETLQPIPARLGGPVTLAFPSTCQKGVKPQSWVTFVEELEITTP